MDEMEETSLRYFRYLGIMIPTADVFWMGWSHQQTGRIPRIQRHLQTLWDACLPPPQRTQRRETCMKYQLPTWPFSIIGSCTTLQLKNNWDAKFSGSWLGINSTGSQHDMFAAFDCEVESEDINPNEEVWLSGPKVSQTIARRMRKFAKACHDPFIACFPRFDDCR